MYEDNIDYAVARLTGTYIQHEGKAFFVYRVRADENGVACVYAGDCEGNDKYIPLKNLSHTPIPLGYVPKTSKHMYLERLPKRKWKQGICPENTCCIGRDGYNLVEFPGCGAFQNLVTGQYNTKEWCIEFGGAFSKKFFIDKKSSKVYYCGEVVGEVVDKYISFFKGKEYMARRLEKTQ